MEMKLALDVVGGFKTESRGLIEVKVICNQFYRILELEIPVVIISG